MRNSIREFVKVCDEVFALEGPVYEFGSRCPAGQESAPTIRSLFDGRVYVGCDLEPGLGVDRLEDVEALSLPEASVGTAIFVDTAEHVRRPGEAVSQIARVLKPGGTLVMASVMDFPIHNHPHDYWRFTPEGFALLLEAFEERVIGWQGYEAEPHTVFGIGFKAPRPEAKLRFESGRDRLEGLRSDGALHPLKKRAVQSLLRAPGLVRGGYLTEALRKYAAYDETRFRFLGAESPRP